MAIIGESLLKMAIFANYNFENWLICSTFAKTKPQGRYMEKIIGRNKELEKLSDYMQSGRSEFVAVYGRRRVGETFLIRSFFKD